MCVGVPMQVVSAEPGVALCEGRGRRERIGTLLTGDQPAGAWILVYQGSAVRTMTAEEAAATAAALDALEAALAGETDFDGYFADLAAREPQLPPHLKGNGR
jgi:hydrogenase expression/formation protein HypC